MSAYLPVAPSLSRSTLSRMCILSQLCQPTKVSDIIHAKLAVGLCQLRRSRLYVPVLQTAGRQHTADLRYEFSTSPGTGRVQGNNLQTKQGFSPWLKRTLASIDRPTIPRSREPLATNLLIFNETKGLSVSSLKNCYSSSLYSMPGIGGVPWGGSRDKPFPEVYSKMI